MNIEMQEYAMQWESSCTFMWIKISKVHTKYVIKQKRQAKNVASFTHAKSQVEFSENLHYLKS